MLYYHQGYIPWSSTDPLNTTYAKTVGFTPKAIKLYFLNHILEIANNPSRSDLAVSIGFASSTTSRASIAAFSADNSPSADCGSGWSNTCCLLAVNAAGAVIGKLDVNSIDESGFTLIVDQALPNSSFDVLVFYQCWGGSDITDVTIGAIAEPAATGTQNYTATGFVASPIAKDQCVMFAGTQTVSATDIAEQQDAGYMFGVATSTSSLENIVVAGNSDDASASADTDMYNYTGDCIAQVNIGGGNINARAALSAFGTNLFTLNWVARAVTNRRYIYMAIKGGLWQAGNLSVNGNSLGSTSSISTANFLIRGGNFMGNMTANSTAGTTKIDSQISMGGIMPTYTNDVPPFNIAAVSYAASILDDDGQGTMVIYGARDLGNSSLKTVLTYSNNAGTLITSHDATISANRLSVEVTLAGGVANEWIGYLIFGDNSRMTSVGHPFIA